MGKFNKNQTVYFFDAYYETVIKGKVIRHLSKSSIIETSAIVNASGTIIEEYEKICERNFENIYDSPRKAYNALKKFRNDMTLLNCEKINNVADLISFPLENFLTHDGSINYFAIDAYKIKAKELLGVVV